MPPLSAAASPSSTCVKRRASRCTSEISYRMLGLSGEKMLSQPSRLTTSLMTKRGMSRSTSSRFSRSTSREKSATMTATWSLGSERQSSTCAGARGERGHREEGFHGVSGLRARKEAREASARARARLQQVRAREVELRDRELELDHEQIARELGLLAAQRDADLVEHCGERLLRDDLGAARRPRRRHVVELEHAAPALGRLVVVARRELLVEEELVDGDGALVERLVPEVAVVALLARVLAARAPLALLAVLVHVHRVLGRLHRVDHLEHLAVRPVRELEPPAAGRVEVREHEALERDDVRDLEQRLLVDVVHEEVVLALLVDGPRSERC